MLFHYSFFDRNETIFFFLMQYYGMSRHKISFAQAFISYFITEMIGFCCICLFPRTTSDAKFYFVSLSMQSNVNRIFFMEGLNLISFQVSQKVLKTIFVIDFFTKNIFCQEIIWRVQSDSFQRLNL